VQIQQWSWSAFAASVPVGFIVVAILNMNNTRDYQDDLLVHKRTLPVRFGQKFGQRFHAFLLLGSYVAVTLFALTRLLPLLSLLVWLTFPLAFVSVRSVLQATDRSAFVVGIKKTSQLHLVFGAVFALAIVLSIFIKL
jgi:1,4-dihydroxy-2-naphthoate octaprenyltransferase